tara:strand:+ start:2760 stop:4160 length:1401 start_codon:yes stop_codon:yes gene_type:complete
MDNKEKYGEVFTPLEIIDEMFSHSEIFIIEYLEKASHLKIINVLDVGTGDGKFIKSFIEKYPILSRKIIFYGLEKNENCKNIFHENIKSIKNYPDYNIKFVNADIKESVNVLTQIKFDFIMGNPPFNNNGLIKVPCNNKIIKKDEGKSIWHVCIAKSLNMLKDGGFLLFVSPCLWLKPDKSNTYENLVNENELLLIKNYDSKESHKIFKYKAQTPVNYFLVRKKYENKPNQKINNITIYDINNNNFLFNLKYNFPIPTHNIHIVNICQQIMEKYNIGNLSRVILKSNPVDIKKYGITNNISETNKYKNIKTCILNRKTNNYDVKYEYSTLPCPFYNSSKIFCAHKRLPIYCEDYEGKYGISKRDTYVITEIMLNEIYAPKITPYNSKIYLKLLYEYLNSDFVKSICMCTRYRMNFLEKYAYMYVPNILEYYMKIIEIDEFLSNPCYINSIQYLTLVNNFINLCKSN